ncbi:MAG: hypothetical protein KGS09_19865 [Nitrospirae bacterium]|nr:hypothetical protein [Nitrospirota bacterium]
MTCSRCRGLMVEGQFLDVRGAYGQMWTTSWRCVNCGCVHDSVIEQHRLARQEPVLVLPSGEPDYQDDEVHLESETFIRRAA